MSVSLILHDENRKTLGGYLWIFLTLSTVITLWMFDIDFSDLKSMTSFISLYIILASFLSLACITIRPETLLNRLLFKDRKIPPCFSTNENLPLTELIESPLLAKERDNFWGNFLIGIGFIIAIFLPLGKVIESEFIFYFEIVKIVLALLVAFIIIVNWYTNQIKVLRNRIEIIWRYMVMLSQMGWKEYYTEQIKALEESLKLRLWRKAEYQVNELNELYRDDLDHILTHLVDFNNSYRFLLGVSEFKETFKSFDFNDLKKFYDRARILGMEYHNSEIFTDLTTKIGLFNDLKNDFNEYSNKLRDRFGKIKKIYNEKLDVKMDHFQGLFNQLDYSLYHVEPKVVESPEFEKVKKFALESKDEELINWFDGVKNTSEFYKKFTADFRYGFTRRVKLRMSNLGETNSTIDESLKGIGNWINKFLTDGEKIKEGEERN